MKQETLAAALGYRSRVSISHIETGREDLPLMKVFALAEALAVPAAELFAPVSALALAPPAWPPWLAGAAELPEAERHLVQRVVAFLLDAGADLRRRLAECLEELQAFKETRRPQWGASGVGAGDPVAG